MIIDNIYYIMYNTHVLIIVFINLVLKKYSNKLIEIIVKILKIGKFSFTFSLICIL